MRILVTPERLDDLSRQMSQAAGELRELEGRLGRAVGGLDWEVRQQVNVEGQVNAARRQAQSLAGEAERLARFLTERAAAFRQADAQGAESLSATTQAYFKAMPPFPIPVPTPVPPAQAVQPHFDLGALLTPVAQISEYAATLSVPAVLLYLASRMKTDSLGITHVFGPQWLKEWAGLSSHLTRIRPEHLARHWLREELRHSFSPLANLQTALGLLPTFIEDLKTYAGQGWAAVVSAILVDGTISIATSKVFQIGGAAVGTVLTPVLGPLGPVGGYIVGGAVASYVEDWLRQTPGAQAARNAVRQGLKQFGRWSGNLIQSALDAVIKPVF